jgi:hypothetical protein
VIAGTHSAGPTKPSILAASIELNARDHRKTSPSRSAAARRHAGTLARIAIRRQFCGASVRLYPWRRIAQIFLDND